MGSLPTQNSDELKQTNEIKTVIPLLDPLPLEDKDLSADALLAQRKIADYIVLERKAHYHFTIQGNPKGILEDVALFFQDRLQPQFVHYAPPDHGRIEIRKIWTTLQLNNYLDFPHVGQAFVIERHRTVKKSGKRSVEVVYGITSRTPEQADPQRVLTINRGHWVIENSCHHVLDWNYDEDRGRIRTGYGPENVTRIRRFAIGLIKSKRVRSVAHKMRQLNRNIRLVFDYLRMSQNTCVPARL